MSNWTAASSDCGRDDVHIRTADLYRPNARFTPERQRYQVLTPFGKLGYSRKDNVVTVKTMAAAKAVDANLVEIVQSLLSPLYERFDFTKLPLNIVQDELKRLRERR